MATAAKKSQYGTKFVCYKCECKFYDLNKPTPLCPKCGADQRQAPKVPDPSKAHKAPKRAPVPVVPEVVEDVPAEDAEAMDFEDDEFPAAGGKRREPAEGEEEEEEDEG